MTQFLKKFWGISLVLCCMSFHVHAQDEHPFGVQAIDSLLEAGNTMLAQEVLQQHISRFRSNGQIDSLYQFPIYLGKLEAKKTNSTKAASVAKDFIEELSTLTNNHRTLFKAYLSLDKLYVFLGDDASSVIASKKALEYAKTTPDVTQEELGLINYTIGGNYYALYDLSNAVDYFKASVAAYEKAETAKKDKLADAYNGVAVSMWTLNKLDIAEVYFHKAIQTTRESDLTDYDRDYYIVAFQFNLALVVDAQGNIGEAIDLKKQIISTLQDIINGSQDDFLVKKSKRLQASAISNLAAFYHDTGYLTRAYEMLQYAHDKKKEVFGVDSPRLATSAHQIATSEIELLEYDKSIATVETALKNLRKAPSRYLSVEADLLYSMAKAYSAKKEMARARELYEQSDALYREAYPDEYSREYLILLRDYAQFLVENGETELGITTAKKSYDYVKKSGGEANFPLIKEITNVSQVYFDSGDYENAHYWAQQGDAFLDGQLSRAASQIDSIQVEFYRPTITHLEVRSLLKMTNQTSTAFIEEQLDKIDDAVAVLERRKTTTFSTDDINKLLIEYKSLNNLSKGLYHQLFTRTGETRFLDKTMAIQESGIYNRIRTQFNSRNNIRFGGIPQETLNREQQLKQTLKEALQPKEGEPISSYFDANEAWVLFLDSLKIQYPKYYKVRYATIEQPITNLQKNVPSETTVIRYLFINDGLYALVLTSTKKDLIFLSDELPADKISQLAETQGDLQLVAPIYHDLFQLLWKPIEQLVSTEKVIIIPDGALFNLSFETLTPTRIATFGDLATNSLLARHHISYNYSLLLLDESQKSVDYGNNFVAFAPEFSEQMKAAYSIAIVDSLELDKTYLTLLPQPFSIDMAEEYSRRFNGNSYLNENSTKQLFTANAREHKIIHIATHAESNNISPELSRLVFAKNLDDDASIADNYLYTFEIYNQNLSSNLAILTACETGKPTHQPGEGMISLAHAFNYAGSESILTSLWKVDEQSSNQIIGYFYENLESGMAKDEALRNAKLSYIANAGGRTAAPHYWAGLVLMGDPAPVPLSSGIPTWLWIVIGLVVIGLIFFFGSKRRS